MYNRATSRKSKKYYPRYTEYKISSPNINSNKYFSEELLKLPPSSAGVYRKPLYYGLIHIISGFLAFHYAWFGVVFLIYQLSQLILNKRFFIFQLRIENGNSIGHTAFKLGEFLLGIFIAYIIHKIFPKFKLPKDRFSDKK